jgi:crotonobetainyl-CoA:carnitine CoA-transferase CaiB-like acyl-CoA transferase
MDSVLSKLKIVEISTVLAGPSVGMFFAERGAEVIKVENKRTNGDVTRTWKLPSEDKDSSISAYFLAVNWNKKHVFLDFTVDSDKTALNKLISTADIIITNFKNKDAEKFELDFLSMQKINSSFILGEISSFGPDSNRVAYDLVLQAESGFMSINGNKDSGPVKMPVAFIDLFAAHQLKEGILEALLERQVNGGSYQVEVSLFDSAVSSLANQATNWLMGKEIPQRIGSIHPNISPYGELFNTADQQQITFAVGSDKQFKALCAELSLNELVESNNYNTNKNRVKNRNQLALLIAEKVKHRESSELLDKLHARNVPCGVIKNIKEVFENEETKKLLLAEQVNDVDTSRVRTSVYSIKKA